MRAIRVICMATCVSAIASAQAGNLVKNGDFQANLTPWTLKGAAYLPRISPFDCNGDGMKSAAFCVTPQSTQGAFYVHQPIGLTAGRKYWYRIHVAWRGSLPKGHWANFSLFTGTSATRCAASLVHTKSLWAGADEVLANHIEVAGLLTATAATRVLTLAFKASATVTSFQICVDDVELYDAGPIPWSTCTTFRSCSGAAQTRVDITTFGSPTYAYMVFVGGARLPATALPGIDGFLEIHPATIRLMLGPRVLNGVGRDTLTFTMSPAVCAAIRGIKLYWAPFQLRVLPTPSAAIGKAAAWSWQ